MLLGTRLRSPRVVRGAAAMAFSVCLLAGHARAQSTSDDLARRHFDSGVAYLEESDYENALKAFEKAHELSRRPEILLNIATVHERQSDLQAAVASLKAYLDAAPQGEHVETVKLRVQNLEKRMQEQDAARPPAPAPPPTVAPPPPPAEAKLPPPPPPQGEPNRLPAFIALGVGGVMAGGSVVTGILAKSKYDDAEAGCGRTRSCSDDQLSSSRTLAITSTVLTGAAVLGVGLGVALLLTSSDEADSVGKGKPRLDVALGPRAAAASALWSF